MIIAGNFICALISSGLSIGGGNKLWVGGCVSGRAVDQTSFRLAIDTYKKVQAKNTSFFYIEGVHNLNNQQRLMAENMQMSESGQV